MLRGQQRGVGMCTDVALYLLHAGGRLIPLPPTPEGRAAYDAACGARTARVLLETIYSEFISAAAGPGVTYLFLLNSEHMFEWDSKHHARVDLFLCKTRFCERLLQKHVRARGLRGGVRFMGHSSGDPLVDLPAGVERAGVRAGGGGARSPAGAPAAARECGGARAGRSWGEGAPGTPALQRGGGGAAHP
jgi:hypothetical protein